MLKTIVTYRKTLEEAVEENDKATNDRLRAEGMRLVSFAEYLEEETSVTIGKKWVCSRTLNREYRDV